MPISRGRHVPGEIPPQGRGFALVWEDNHYQTDIRWPAASTTDSRRSPTNCLSIENTVFHKDRFALQYLMRQSPWRSC